jgi:hypothetical protein
MSLKECPLARSLKLVRSFHGTHLHAGFAFQAEFYINKCPILNKPNGCARTKVNATPTANTFFPVNLNHDVPPLKIIYLIALLKTAGEVSEKPLNKNIIDCFNQMIKAIFAF